MLSSKLALVSGAASGIGFQIARIFAKEGAAVCLVDISNDVNSALKQLPIHTSKHQHSSHICDISNTDQVHSLFKTVKDQYKDTPTIIVNSAGITRDNLLTKLTEADFDQVIKVNLKGTFLVSQTAVKELSRYLWLQPHSERIVYLILFTHDYYSCSLFAYTRKSITNTWINHKYW